MIPRILEQLDRAHQEFSWTELCYGLISCATILRWRARAKAGHALVEKAGPKKKQPMNILVLKSKIEQLDHCRQRTAGTTALYAQLSDAVSRRRFQQLVAQERQNRIDNMKRIQWLVPGAAWSIDTTECGSEKMKITPLRDLASKYQLPTPLVQSREEGVNIALYLDQMFKKEGAPMFLKRDLGSPLNCQAVDQVLEQYRVLPLNSPPGYPRYNGSIERSMRDLHAALDQRRMNALQVPISIELECRIGITNKLDEANAEIRSRTGRDRAIVFVLKYLAQQKQTRILTLQAAAFDRKRSWRMMLPLVCGRNAYFQRNRLDTNFTNLHECPRCPNCFRRRRSSNRLVFFMEVHGELGKGHDESGSFFKNSCQFV